MLFVFPGHRFRPAYDFDYVALDLLSVYPEDSGVYTCHARNAYGEAVSSATIKIYGESSLLLCPSLPPAHPPIQQAEEMSNPVCVIKIFSDYFFISPPSVKNIS
jgi:titin